jgi:hypothetical protein
LTDEPRTYTGWKVGLAIVVSAIVVFTALNLFARAIRHDPAPTEQPASRTGHVITGSAR